MPKSYRQRRGAARVSMPQGGQIDLGRGSAAKACYAASVTRGFPALLKFWKSYVQCRPGTVLVAERWDWLAPSVTHRRLWRSKAGRVLLKPPVVPRKRARALCGAPLCSPRHYMLLSDAGSYAAEWRCLGGCSRCLPDHTVVATQQNTPLGGVAEAKIVTGDERPCEGMWHVRTAGCSVFPYLCVTVTKILCRMPAR
jgi:hypothetical protein